uniref:NADH-ubiquinone oxidoreductase chain 4 n=1 Tax=Rybaxis sp. 1 EF-2015 TaxID=1756864 RepID=A0A0S2M861_9COLE|nr:NADH deshydrogenase subunit 4 [Rybaxis sp. 1 EF-2015]
MMKILFMMIFMIPLSFLNYYWMFQFLFFMFFFMFIFNYSYSFLLMNISYLFGVDVLGFVMILLSLWICSLMIMASNSIYKNNFYYSLFMFMLILMMIFLYCTFSSINLFVFYLFFEMSLIPMLILILGWGYQPERLQAGIYLLFYTLFASLPMMISIFFYYNNFMSLMFMFMLNEINSIMLYIFMNLVFFIKMPMFLVHLWLPKAHVEAPISGSMILAGVLLKLGGYGLIRVMMMFISINNKINFIFISISLIGGVLVSLMCLRQTDMKSLVAYSSVAHMGLVMSGILTLNYWGIYGSIIMMLAHGLCSSGLFCLVNISYERTMSRSFYLNKGMINLMPNLSLWWFLLISSNMAAPPSLNLLGEIMLINSLLSWNVLNMVCLMLLSFFSAVYSLFLYSYTQHGKFYIGLYSFFCGYLREYLLLMLHWLPLNILFLKSDFM